MDAAYDHIQEESFPEDDERRRGGGQTAAQNDGKNEQSINQEFQEAYKAFSASPWGVKLGGFWASAKKQGEQYYATATQEVSTASETATKGFSDLANRARTLTISSPPTSPRPDAATSSGTAAETREDGEGDDRAKDKEAAAHPDRPDSLPADIYKEASAGATSLAARFKTEAARRLKEAQKLEDAADEALLAWGTSLGAFLKDAVSIAPPSAEDVEQGKGEVLFASKDPESGKRVVHATRLDAQLHVIHCSMDSFLKDPKSGEWDAWKADFEVEKRTEEIARDLERYEQLRRAMEKLVPEQVEYGTFWARYYFLRHVVETEETRRRELLKGAATNTEEEVAWDDESDDEASAAATPKNGQSSSTTTANTSAPSEKPHTTPPKPAAKDDSDNATLKPAEPRKSNEHSSAGSDASYDLVSGATSRTPGSPTGKKADDSDDEDDWE